MRYSTDWRLIFLAMSETEARDRLCRFAGVLGRDVNPDVFEPFSEAEGQYDCVFTLSYEANDKDALLTDVSRLVQSLPGEWEQDPPRFYENGVVELHATTSGKGTGAGIAWGHVWARSQD